MAKPSLIALPAAAKLDGDASESRPPRVRSNWDFNISKDGKEILRVSKRGGVTTLVFQGLKFALQIGSLYVLGRLISPDDFGVVAMVAALLTFVLIFKDLGLSAATIQTPEISHEQVNSLFWINVAVSSLAAGCTAVFAHAVSGFFHRPELTGIVLFSSIGLIMGGLGVQHQALLSRKMRYTTLARIDITSVAVGAAAAIILAMEGFGYWALVFQQLTQILVSTALSWAACSWLPSRPQVHSTAFAMLRFGKNLTGFSLLNYFARNLDNVLIGRFWGAIDLGLYSKAYQILLLPLGQLNAPIQAVAFPTLSRLTASPEEYRTTYCKAIRLLALVSMGGVGYMLVVADWIIPLILGPSWSGASPIYKWLGVCGLIQPVASSTGWLFMSQGRGGDMFRWAVISTAISVASIFVGLRWGAMGVAACYSIASVAFVCPLLFWFVTRKGPVLMGDFYRVLALPAGVVTGSYGLLYLFRKITPNMSPAIGCALTFLVWIVVYSGLLTLFSEGRASLKDVGLLLANVNPLGSRRTL